MKFISKLLQFYCLIACHIYAFAISLECDVPFLFVWTKDVEKVKACEIYKGEMRNEHYKLIGDELQKLENKFAVQALYIHDTTHTKFPKNLNINFERLTDIRVESTDLAVIDSDVMSGLEKIKRLYLGKNKISSIAHNAFDDLVDLKILLLNNNSITFLDGSTFRKLVNLEKISLSFNRLTEISKKLFSANTKLKEIHLRSNELIAIDHDAFDNIVSLKALDLRGNKCIDVSTFPNYKKLADILCEIVKECFPTSENHIGGSVKETNQRDANIDKVLHSQETSSDSEYAAFNSAENYETYEVRS